MKMNTKKLVLNAVLLGIGVVLHEITPPIFGIKPDMTLIMLFTIAILNRDNFATCLVAGIITGVFCAMTTSFPGGQVPNLIDKTLTASISFLIMMFMYKLPFMKKLAGKNQDFAVSTVLMIIGTGVSGFIFLFSAKVLVGLPGGMGLAPLFAAVVLPAIVINLIVGCIIFKVVHVTMKRVSYQS